jgi:hypothetical protein
MLISCRCSCHNKDISTERRLLDHPLGNITHQHNNNNIVRQVGLFRPIAFYSLVCRRHNTHLHRPRTAAKGTDTGKHRYIDHTRARTSHITGNHRRTYQQIVGRRLAILVGRLRTIRHKVAMHITLRDGVYIDHRDDWYRALFTLPSPLLYVWLFSAYCLHPALLFDGLSLGELVIPVKDYEFIVLLALLCIRTNFTTKIISTQFKVYIHFHITVGVIY